MAFRIEYSSKGIKVGADPCPTTLDEAYKAALIGLGIHRADLARILDMDHKGAVVRVVKRDA